MFFSIFQGFVDGLRRIRMLENSNSVPSDRVNSSLHTYVPALPRIIGGSPTTSKVLPYIDGVVTYVNRMSRHYDDLSSYGRRYPSAPLAKSPSKAVDIIDPTTGEKLPI